jgi:hypothetical protein
MKSVIGSNQRSPAEASARATAAASICVNVAAANAVAPKASRAPTSTEPGDGRKELT